MIYILTGDIGSGKTTAAAGIYEILVNQGFRPGGIISPGFMKNGVKSEYFVRDLMTGTEHLLCSREKNPDWIKLGGFWFDPVSVEFGNDALLGAAAVCDSVLFIDEIGPFEMSGNGWHNTLKLLLKTWHKPMVWTVRTSLAETVPAFYGIQDYKTIEARNCSIREIACEISPELCSDQ